MTDLRGMRLRLFEESLIRFRNGETSLYDLAHGLRSLMDAIEDSAFRKLMVSDWEALEEVNALQRWDEDNKERAAQYVVVDKAVSSMLEKIGVLRR